MNFEGTDQKRVRHILSVSGGKDSAALAVYMRDRVPEMEYVFCDTHEELPETYAYIERLEAYLGKPIVRLNPDRPFAHHLAVKGGYLPSPRMRWCTELLKIRPFENYVGDDPVLSYIGIRADEDREGYISHKLNIHPVYPFKDDGITIDDVIKILEDSGLGLPEYYSWRTRSGCYFCFFQRKVEWVGLLEKHPDLFEKAKSFERHDSFDNRRFTWTDGESLEELGRPERVAEIRRNHAAMMARIADQKGNRLPLIHSLGDDSENAEGVEPCLICHL